MIHHVSLGTTDVERSKKFYTPILTLLGLRLIQEDKESLDYGTSRIFFSLESPSDGEKASAGNGVHIAFDCEHRKMVDEFYRLGLESGGRGAGAPGIRDKYNKHYYGAFLLDPDGNKVEAMTYSAD